MHTNEAADDRRRNRLRVHIDPVCGTSLRSCAKTWSSRGVNQTGEKNDQKSNDPTFEARDQEWTLCVEGTREKRRVEVTQEQVTRYRNLWSYETRSFKPRIQDLSYLYFCSEQRKDRMIVDQDCKRHGSEITKQRQLGSHIGPYMDSFIRSWERKGSSLRIVQANGQMIEARTLRRLKISARLRQTQHREEQRDLRHGRYTRMCWKSPNRQNTKAYVLQTKHWI